MTTAQDRRRTLPRRDLILLPLTSLLTIGILVGGSEIYARIFWPAKETNPCFMSDPMLGYRYRANCNSRTKLVEGPWVDNQYNECGYRSSESCGPKRPGTIRIAVLGSSYSFGYMVPYEQIFTTRAAHELTRQCGHTVEFMNLGVESYSMVQTYRRSDEALALKPDLLLLAITGGETAPVSPAALAHRNDPQYSLASGSAQVKSSWFHEHIAFPLKSSRALVVLQHYVYANPDRFLKLFLLQGGKADYVRTRPSATIRAGLDQFDVILAEMAAKARRAGVPFVIMVGPAATQVALLNSAHRPGTDPEEYPRLIAGEAAKYGIPVIDALPKMKVQFNPMELFYAANGHMNAEGQQLLADALDEALLSNSLPAFTSCSAGPPRTDEATR
jgi:hypothetical protein